MLTGAAKTDNERALCWLDEALEDALDREQEKLVHLLGAVREEISFEMALAGMPTEALVRDGGKGKEHYGSNQRWHLG